MRIVCFFFILYIVLFLAYVFLIKDKANERTGHLMISDHRRPRHRVTPEELQVRCRPDGGDVKQKSYYCPYRNVCKNKKNGQILTKVQQVKYLGCNLLNIMSSGSFPYSLFTLKFMNIILPICITIVTAYPSILKYVVCDDI